MKYFYLVCLILFSSKSEAFPEVGNYVRFLATHNGKVFEYKKTLLEFDSEMKSFTMIEKISTDDEIVQERVTQLPSFWFYTEAKVQNVLKTCTRREGALGKVLVEGKEIPTCTFYSEESQMDYIIGMVPFGQIRFQHYLGKNEFLDFYLQDFY